MLTLPSPPFTPASLPFTLGFIYTSTLIFSHRTHDLSTAFGILRSALYLSLTPSTTKFKPVLCRKCCTFFSTPLSPLPNTSVLLEENGAPVDVDVASARRAPRVLEFALEEDVKNTSLERDARRALVGLFGEGWCTQEFAGLP